LLLGAFLSARDTPAKARARTAMCRSQMRQMVAALQMYAQDHDGFFPSDLDWEEEMLRRLRIPPPYACPEVERGERDGGTPGAAGRLMPGYAINAYLVNPPRRAGQRVPRPVNVAHVRHPAATVAFCEARRGYAILKGPDAPWGRPTLDGGRRHDGGAHYAFVDGSVRWYWPHRVNGFDDRLPPDGVTPDFKAW
jgi:prepilin-type processing-associated H-X9-DG protein